MWKRPFGNWFGRWVNLKLKDNLKRFYIVHRDPVKGDLAAEVALSGWSHTWLVAVYNDKTGAVHELWQTGLESKARAMAYVKDLQDLARQLKNGTEIDLT